MIRWGERHWRSAMGESRKNKVWIHFFNRHWLDITIEIPRAAAADEYKAIPILEIPMTLPPVRCFE